MLEYRMKILITRPKNQAEKLRKELTQHGFETLLFPTLEIQKIENAPTNNNDIAIFVSKNAVDYGLSSWPKNILLPPTLLAVGPATAQCINEAGHSVAELPEDYSSEGLLKLPSLHNVNHKKIVIVCGENSNPLLKNTLMHRGAKIEELICYRRLCPTVDAKTIIEITQQKIDVIVSTSQESLRNLVTLFSAHSEWLLQQRLLVISNTMLHLAQTLGFHTLPLLAPNATDGAIVNTLRFQLK